MGTVSKFPIKENNLPLLPWIFINISNYGIDGYDANSPNSSQTF